MYVWMDGWMDVWMYGCMDVWMYGCTDVWMYGCMDVCMYVCRVSKQSTNDNAWSCCCSSMIVCLYMFVLSGLLIQHLGFGATAAKLRHAKDTLAFSMGVGLRPYGSPTNASSPAERHSNSISRSGPQILISGYWCCLSQAGGMHWDAGNTYRKQVFFPEHMGFPVNCLWNQSDVHASL